MKMNFWSKSTADTVPREVVLSSMPDRFRLPLLSLYAGEPQRGKNGELFQHDPQSRIEAAQGMWMYSLCREIDPKETCEIGLGYGYSTIYILAAIHANGCGAHLAIDPYQAAYHEIGMSQAKTIGMEDAFRLIPEKSSLALTDLIRKERAFDFIYIDGGHRFDDAYWTLYWRPICARLAAMLFSMICGWHPFSVLLRSFVKIAWTFRKFRLLLAIFRCSRRYLRTGATGTHMLIFDPR